MPLLRIVTSARPSETVQRSLLHDVSALLAERLGKPESYVMTSLVPDIAMTFAGTTEPACFVELKNIGSFTPKQTRTLSSDLCQRLAVALDVPAARIYIEFTNAQGHLWGHDGETFA